MSDHSEHHRHAHRVDDAHDAPAAPDPQPEQNKEPEQADQAPAPVAPEHPVVATPPSPWQVLVRAAVPRATRGQVVTGLLCAVLGFALVVQVQANREDPLATLRQDELVRLLDDVTRNGEDLEAQVAQLRAQRNELVTATDGDRAAREAARERAEVQGILAGRLPAEGPGIEVVIADPTRGVPATALYTLLEELRNAGAEAIQLGDQRLTASSYIIDAREGIVVDGVAIDPPYRWLAIGDPDTMTTALGIPGGALAVIRNAGGVTTVTPGELLQVTAVKQVDPPRYATPVPVEETE